MVCVLDGWGCGVFFSCVLVMRCFWPRPFLFSKTLISSPSYDSLQRCCGYIQLCCRLFCSSHWLHCEEEERDTPSCFPSRGRYRNLSNRHVKFDQMLQKLNEGVADTCRHVYIDVCFSRFALWSPFSVSQDSCLSPTSSICFEPTCQGVSTPVPTPTGMLEYNI